jgi:sporulation integral membrane protein YlbJ
MIKVVKLRKLIIPTLFVLFAISLVLFSSSNLSAAQNGLNLWATSVIPSLFPFFVATELLSYTNIVNILGRCFNKLMKPLFNVRGEGSFAFLMGIISGYPVGAKIACNLRESNICSKEECERLLAFTNNSGPLFIIGTVGIKMFGSSTIGFLLLITHILACISVGICFRCWKSSSSINYLGGNNSKKSISNTRVSLSNLGEVISKSITNSISTILNIGGFIVIFSVIISILKHTNFIVFFEPLFKILHIPTAIAESFILGIVEITNGIFAISCISLKKISINIILTAFLLGLGGISILLQVWSIVSKTDLSIKPYVIGKLLHGVFATIYTFLFIIFFPMFQFDLYV